MLLFEHPKFGSSTPEFVLDENVGSARSFQQFLISVFLFSIHTKMITTRDITLLINFEFD